MAIKKFGNQEPTNEEMDAFAMSHHTAIWMRSDDFNTNVIVSTREECQQMRREGLRVKGEISAADFGY